MLKITVCRPLSHHCS